MAELFVTGQIVSASGFGLPSIFCKYSFETGSNFRLLQGLASGQTQCDMPLVRPLHFPLPRVIPSLPCSRLCGGVLRSAPCRLC